MEKIRIRDGKKSGSGMEKKFGSEMNIPDPVLFYHWIWGPDGKKSKKSGSGMEKNPDPG
jgi:hypothetical protein